MHLRSTMNPSHHSLVPSSNSPSLDISTTPLPLPQSAQLNSTPRFNEQPTLNHIFPPSTTLHTTKKTATSYSDGSTQTHSAQAVRLPETLSTQHTKVNLSSQPETQQSVDMVSGQEQNILSSQSRRTLSSHCEPKSAEKSSQLSSYLLKADEKLAEKRLLIRSQIGVSTQSTHTAAGIASLAPATTTTTSTTPLLAASARFVGSNSTYETIKRKQELAQSQQSQHHKHHHHNHQRKLLSNKRQSTIHFDQSELQLGLVRNSSTGKPINADSNQIESTTLHYVSTLNTINDFSSMADIAYQQDLPVVPSQTNLLPLRKRIPAFTNDNTMNQAFAILLYKTPDQRSHEDIELLQKATSFIPFFKKVEKKSHLALSICKAMQYQHFAKGRVVFFYGDFPDHFFITLKGKVCVLTPKKEQDLLLEDATQQASWQQLSNEQQKRTVQKRLLYSSLHKAVKRLSNVIYFVYSMKIRLNISGRSPKKSRASIVIKSSEIMQTKTNLATLEDEFDRQIARSKADLKVEHQTFKETQSRIRASIHKDMKINLARSNYHPSSSRLGSEETPVHSNTSIQADNRREVNKKRGSVQYQPIQPSSSQASSIERRSQSIRGSKQQLHQTPEKHTVVTAQSESQRDEQQRVSSIERIESSNKTNREKRMNGFRMRKGDSMFEIDEETYIRERDNLAKLGESIVANQQETTSILNTDKEVQNVGIALKLQSASKIVTEQRRQVKSIVDLFVNFAAGSQAFRVYQSTKNAVESKIKGLDLEKLENASHFFKNNTFKYNHAVTAGDGLVFGELGILNKKPRSATVVCLEDCYFGTLSLKKYEEILMNQQNASLVKKRELIMETLCAGEEVSNEKISKIAHSFHTRKYQAGEIIYKEGERSMCIYLIKKGEVELQKQEEIVLGAQEIFKATIRVAKLTSREYFGDCDIHFNRNRFFTAVATAVTTVYFCDKDQFLKNTEDIKQNLSTFEKRVEKKHAYRLKVISDSMRTRNFVKNLDSLIQSSSSPTKYPSTLSQVNESTSASISPIKIDSRPAVDKQLMTKAAFYSQRTSFQSPTKLLAKELQSQVDEEDEYLPTSPLRKRTENSSVRTSSISPSKLQHQFLVRQSINTANHRAANTDSAKKLIGSHSVSQTPRIILKMTEKNTQKDQFFTNTERIERMQLDIEANQALVKERQKKFTPMTPHEEYLQMRVICTSNNKLFQREEKAFQRRKEIDRLISETKNRRHSLSPQKLDTLRDQLDVYRTGSKPMFFQTFIQTDENFFTKKTNPDRIILPSGKEVFLEDHTATIASSNDCVSLVSKRNSIDLVNQMQEQAHQIINMRKTDPQSFSSSSSSTHPHAQQFSNTNNSTSVFQTSSIFSFKDNKRPKKSFQFIPGSSQSSLSQIKADLSECESPLVYEQDSSPAATKSKCAINSTNSSQCLDDLDRRFHSLRAIKDINTLNSLSQNWRQHSPKKLSAANMRKSQDNLSELKTQQNNQPGSQIKFDDSQIEKIQSLPKKELSPSPTIISSSTKPNQSDHQNLINTPLTLFSNATKYSHAHYQHSSMYATMLAVEAISHSQTPQHNEVASDLTVPYGFHSMEQPDISIPQDNKPSTPPQTSLPSASFISFGEFRQTAEFFLPPPYNNSSSNREQMKKKQSIDKLSPKHHEVAQTKPSVPKETFYTNSTRSDLSSQQTTMMNSKLLPTQSQRIQLMPLQPSSIANFPKSQSLPQLKQTTKSKDSHIHVDELNPLDSKQQFLVIDTTKKLYTPVALFRPSSLKQLGFGKYDKVANEGTSSGSSNAVQIVSQMKRGNASQPKNNQQRQPRMISKDTVTAKAATHLNFIDGNRTENHQQLIESKAPSKFSINPANQYLKSQVYRPLQLPITEVTAPSLSPSSQLLIAHVIPNQHIEGTKQQTIKYSHTRSRTSDQTNPAGMEPFIQQAQQLPTFGNTQWVKQNQHLSNPVKELNEYYPTSTLQRLITFDSSDARIQIADIIQQNDSLQRDLQRKALLNSEMSARRPINSVHQSAFNFDGTSSDTAAKRQRLLNRMNSKNALPMPLMMPRTTSTNCFLGITPNRMNGTHAQKEFAFNQEGMNQMRKARTADNNVNSHMNSRIEGKFKSFLQRKPQENILNKIFSPQIDEMQ